MSTASKVRFQALPGARTSGRGLCARRPAPPDTRGLSKFSSGNSWRGARRPSRGSSCVQRVQAPQSPQPTAQREIDTTRPEHQSSRAASEYVDWRKQWYAVRPVADLPVDRPMGDRIMGKEVVIWRDAQGEWRVFEDRCPHRKVALSEGRIEQDGTLACAYHGWRFNGEGACTTIPQLMGEDTSVQRVLSRPAACAVQFPCKVSKGLLFVWMDSGPGSLEESEGKPVAGMPEAFKHWTNSWFTRDMEMSAEVLLENLIDPAHFPFSHHGVMGNRNKPSKVAFDALESHGASGYAVKYPPADNSPMILSVGFPNFVCYNNSAFSQRMDENGVPVRHGGAFHVTPLTRLTSRISFRFAATAPPVQRSRLPFGLSNRTWVDHLARNAVLDGDSIFLSGQARLHAAAAITHKDYFMPASADQAVVQLWRTMERHCPAGPNFYEHETPAPTMLPRTQVLDRLEQHTKWCHACSKVLERVLMAQRVLLGVLVAAAVTGLIRGVAGVVGLWDGLACGGLVGGCLLGVWLLQKLVTRLTFADYVHSERD